MSYAPMCLSDSTGFFAPATLALLLLEQRGSFRIDVNHDRNHRRSAERDLLYFGQLTS